MESFSGVVPIIPPKKRYLVLTKAHETHPGKNANEVSVKTIAWWPRITQEAQHFVTKTGLVWEKHSSTGPQAYVWERLHMDCGYGKYQDNI